MTSRTAPGRAWPTITGLVALWVLVLAEQLWIFALLFLGWALYDIVTGESNFIETIQRRTDRSCSGRLS